MKVIARHSLGKKVVGDTLQISVEAKLVKANNPNTIDATIGTFSNEDKSFLKFTTVNNIIKNLSDENFYAYAAVDGGKLYSDAVLEWCFQNTKNEVLSNLSHRVIATPGGTGAVSNAVFVSLDEGETLLLPNIYWGPYKGIANANSLVIEEYPFLINGKFNLEGFKQAADSIIAKQGKLVTILNDPNNNPTGYTLTLDEFQQLINYLNTCGGKVSLIYDIAYIDYSVINRDAAREKFLLLKRINDNVIVSIAFSCSKTFSIYGLRTGAQIILGKNAGDVEELYDASVYLSRSRWSNVTKAGINMLSTLVLNAEHRNTFSKELAQIVELLSNRAKLFIEEADACGLDIYPYSGGFFITVISKDGNQLFELLKTKNIYCIPYPKAIRISISALSISEVKGLAAKIKEIEKTL